MKKHKDKTGEMFFRIVNLLALAAVVISCAAPAATRVKTALTSATDTPSDNAAVTATTPTAARTQTAPPAIFQSQYLNPLDTPRAYIQEPCQYLRARWNPWNSEPGTVVMIIMLHGVRGSTVENPEDVEADELKRIMKQLKAQLFEAINTEQFLAFMERNVKIPPRSALIVRDGRYGKKDFYTNFRQYWYAWKWPVVNGWPSQEDTPEILWRENILMEHEGFVDHQAQGMQVGAYLSEDSSKVIIARELQGPLDMFAQRFAKTPLAFVWPGGGFGQRPVEIARRLGYQLGFTLNSRGPVMYNWVPQADEADKKRPSYIPEGAIKDPLMTLPRYWPHQVLSSIDTVRIMGKDARIYAEVHKAAELKYYKIICEPAYGPIPAP